MRAVTFIVPLIQLMIFGYAVTTDVNHIPTAVYDMDKSYESRELVRRMQASGYFEIRYYLESDSDIRDVLDRGNVLVALQINHGFEKDIIKRNPTQIQVLLDGTDSNTAMVAMSYLNGIISRYSQEKMTGGIRTLPIRLDARTRAWYNPELRSRNYNIPGVIALMIMVICLLLTAMAIVREREIGTMEQLMVTPLRPLELMLGKTIPFACIGIFDMVLVTVVGVNWFHIPIKGSLVLLFISTLIYLLSVLSTGLFISTITKTQQQSLMASFLFFFPAILLSGFMFPIENMPQVIQYVTYINPLRYFIVIIRGIFLKGNGFEILWPQMAALLTIGITLMTVSSLRFKKRLG